MAQVVARSILWPVREPRYEGHLAWRPNARSRNALLSCEFSKTVQVVAIKFVLRGFQYKLLVVVAVMVLGLSASLRM